MPQYVGGPLGVAARHTSPVAEASDLAVGGPPGETCQTFFNALDGRDVMALGRRWRLEVFSVLELVGRRYVQLALEGPTRYHVTLKMQPGAESKHVIPALVPWLVRPTVSGDVIEVQSDGSAAAQTIPRKNNVISWGDWARSERIPSVG